MVWILVLCTNCIILCYYFRISHLGGLIIMDIFLFGLGL
nr:MAG TPA: hypothetical protein [Caudoviricetes sp.]